MEPLSELVSSLLSHRTRNADSGRAFKSLRARLPTWNAVRDAETSEVEEAIAAVTWPEQKSPRIQQILREITARRGELSLDILAALEVAEARRWLEAQLPRGISAQQSYDNHEVLMLHGQRCRYYRAPACHRRVVYSMCPTGQRLHPEVGRDVVQPVSRLA